MRIAVCAMGLLVMTKTPIRDGQMHRIPPHISAHTNHPWQRIGKIGAHTGSHGHLSQKTEFHPPSECLRYASVGIRLLL